MVELLPTLLLILLRVGFVHTVTILETMRILTDVTNYMILC